MLLFYLGRDGGRNNIQHPVPTCQFATKFVKTLPGLSSNDHVATALLIQLSLQGDDIRKPFFDHGEGSDDLDERDLDTELESWVNTPVAEPPQQKAKYDG
jgi:hypothetical protein